MRRQDNSQKVRSHFNELICSPEAIASYASQPAPVIQPGYGRYSGADEQRETGNAKREQKRRRNQSYRADGGARDRDAPRNQLSLPLLPRIFEPNA